jgi:hypothetical protein
MRFKNRNDYGKKIRLGNEIVEISKIGELIHEDKKKIADWIKEYSELFYDEKAKPKKVKKGEDVDFERLLQEKTEYLQRVIGQLKDEVKAAQKDADYYKTKLTELESQVGDKKPETSVEDQLKLKTLKELQTLAEQAKLPKEEWEKLKKEELVAYLSK